VVQAGANVTVTGDGSTANPYIINATLGVLTVQDTSSIDHTLTGAGTPASPYLLSSDVKISAEDGNVISLNPDGLSLTCDDIAACAVPANITSGCGLDGTGAPADPLLVKGLIAWPFACPESNAGDLYCGADGSILAAPPQICNTGQIALGTETGMAGFCGLVPNTGVRTRLSTQPVRGTFANPDPCRPMTLRISAAGIIKMVSDGTDGTGSQYQQALYIGLIIDGVDGAVVQQDGIYGNNGTYHYSINYPPITVAAGDTIDIGSYIDGTSVVACHVENSTFTHPNIIMDGTTCA
jgi:hypothetical protein